MSTTLTGLILMLVGMLAMLGAALNWRVVTHSGKLFNRFFGDKIARVIYFGIGCFMLVKGIEIMIGAHWLPF